MLWEASRFFACYQLVGLGLFTLLFSVRTINLVAHQHINPIALRVKSKGHLGLFEVGFFLWVNLWILAVLAATLPFGQHATWLSWGRLVASTGSRIIGASLIVIAFGFFIAGLLALGDSWRLGIDDRHPGKLVTGGIYRFSRNPIYLFFDLYFLGTFLINGSLLFLGFAVATVAGLHYQSLQEEKFLAWMHGAAYESYRAGTARYFSWRHRPLRVPGRVSQATYRGADPAE